MKIIKFKTNIDSVHKLAEIKQVLNSEELISKWNLDLSSQNKILSVSGNEITPEIINELLRKKGFSAEVIRVVGVGGHDL